MIIEEYVEALNRMDVEAANSYVHPDAPAGNISTLDGSIYDTYDVQGNETHVPKNTGDEALVNIT